MTDGTHEASNLARLGLDATGEVTDLVEQAAALGHQVLDLAIRMHHGGVIPSAESLTDLGQ